MKMRRSPQTAQVLAEFLNSRQEWSYGYDISRNTGLKSGTLYPILMRLAEHRLLETSWETSEEGRPPRHLYKLTSDGLRYAIELVSASPEQAAQAIGESAFGMRDVGSFELGMPHLRDGFIVAKVGTFERSSNRPLSHLSTPTRVPGCPILRSFIAKGGMNAANSDPESADPPGAPFMRPYRMSGFIRAECPISRL
jgi:DNA-binding PadR family transcriptional regulator